MKSDYETKIEKELKIETSGRDDFKADSYHHPYEPTPYAVLKRLVESEYVTKDAIFVDYGCGKGRVDFYISAKIGCQTVGIDFDNRLVEKAQINSRNFIGKRKPEFVCMPAEDYEIGEADSFYFFNPFSIEILHSVMGKIITSYYTNPRQRRLFFYYPSDEYVAYLMTNDELMFVDEIDCGDLFDGDNKREKILIFEIG